MKIYNSIEEFEKTGYESYVALGFFDGVHMGHRAVISECVAGKGERQAVILTFSESPSRLLGNTDIKLITDNEKKARLMEELGADAVIFADFLKLKDMSPEEFIDVILYGKLRAKKVVCGYNYRFGKNGSGDTKLLTEKCFALGIGVSVKEPVYLDSAAVSSSAVRELIMSGDMAGAKRMLGYPYTVSGSVGSGNHIGAKMGYPTVNLPIKDGVVVPRYGVYAARVRIGGKTYKGATNIGVHPTVRENSAPLCETFLIDYDGDELYGENIVCEPVSFIRPEKRFASMDELTEQIGKDIEKIKSAADQ